MEAGALVLADMGVCCIDEFNLVKKVSPTASRRALTYSLPHSRAITIQSSKQWSSRQLALRRLV